MKSRLLLLTFTVLLNIVAFAVPDINKPDSLATLLSSTRADTVKAEAAYVLSEYYYRHADMVKAKDYLRKGKILADKSPLWLAIGGYYETLIHEPEDRHRAEQSYLNTERKLQKFTSKDAYYYRAACWYNYGVLQQYKDDQKGFADIVLNKALPLAKKSGVQVFIGKTYWGLGVVFKNILQYPQSEINLKKAIDIFAREHAVAPNLIKAYTTIAETYILESKYNDADNALLKAYSYLTRVDASKDLWIEYYTSRGMYFTATKNYDASVRSIQNGIDIATTSGDNYRRGRLMMQLFYSYYEARNYDSALQTLAQMNCDTMMTVQLTNRLQIYDGYAQTYARKGDYKNAFEWQTKYSTLSDSANTSRLKEDINAMEIKFNTAEKERTISLLKERQKTADWQAKNKNHLILFLVTICILMLALAAVGWSSYRKTSRLNKQKEIFHKQELKQKERDMQLESIRALLEGEEKERSRLARDLHDGLGGMLASLKLKLSAIAEENNWHITLEKLSRIAVPIDRTLQELRRIARNMAPPTLTQFGLEVALRDLCQSIGYHKANIEFLPMNIQPTINEKDQLMIYRIVQELLTNAIKHAEATRILLQCSQNKQLFLITVEDNGKGLISISENKKGMGLSNIQHRVHYMNGKIDITSDAEGGTSFNIELQLGHYA